jgi:hypothetical protein
MQELARAAMAHMISPRRVCVFAFVRAQRAPDGG